MALRVALTGSVGIEAGSDRVDTAGLGRLGRLAFAYLVCHRDRPVPRDELADVVWGEDLPRTWETALRVVASKLRTWLEGAGLGRTEVLTSGFGTYQLHLPPDAVVDVEEAVAAIESAQEALAVGDAAAARAHAAAAAETAAREFLPGATGTWVERRQDELRELRAAALEVGAEAALALGDGAAATLAAEEAVALEPLRESAHLLLIRARAAAGNRAEALRAYERLRRSLGEELGVSPSQGAEALYLSLLGEEPVAPERTGPARAVAGVAGLPADLSPFVGREAELAELAGLVAAGRCVTVAGTGGLGKTRMAVTAARAVAAPDGAVLVPLADAGEPAAVAGLALASFGLAEEPGRRPLDTLAAALAGRRMAVVVDNCEHVVEAAAELVAAVLAAAPGCTVLATSRQPLLVPGEIVWRAPPMGTGDAARLFVDRATAADPTFRVVSGQEPLLDAVCQRLEGIPLALELAAARADVLSLAEIAARLDDRFRLLTGGPRTAPSRHQTLRAAVDWSYESLPPAERDLFERLSVFAGAFTLDAAGAVAGDGGDVLDGLSGLVRRSMVVVAGRGGADATRYRMLETLREYAAERLATSGRAGGAHAALVVWALRLAESAEPHLDGPDQRVWLERLAADHPNLRAALAAAAPGEPAVRLATALGRFWEVRGHLSEGRQALRDVLGAGDAPPLLRARALNAAALLAQRQGDYAAARSRLEESLGLRRQAGDRLGVAAALHGLGNLAALARDLETARRLYEEALDAGRQLGDPALMAAALDNLGWVAHVSADFPSARGYYEEALALQRSLGDVRGVALVLGQLGDLAYQQGEYVRAAACHAESLELRSQLGDRAGRADSLATLGHLALHEGDLDLARHRFAETLAIREELGDRAGLPSAHTNLADLALLGRDASTAGRHLDAAAAAARAARDGATLAHVLVHRARVAQAAGDGQGAAACYAEAAAAAGELAADSVTAEWMEGVAAALADRGEAEVGARLIGAAAGLRDAIGAPVPPHERPSHDADVAAVRSALGHAAFVAATEAGRSADLDEVLAEARTRLAT